MSLFLDQKYLMLISNRLPLFHKKKDNTYNCRCVVCGDSTKKTRKARGYFFAYKTDLRYKCFNCDASMQFGTFLKNLDGNLYQQYSLERYSEGRSLSSNAIIEPKFEQPIFNSSERLIDKILTRLDKLPKDHEAVQYVSNRKIPSTKYSSIYFIENIKDIVQLSEKYKESIRTEEPRIIFPFYDENHQLSGVACRAIRGEALRYITIKIKDDTPLIFGLNEVDEAKDIFVVEGPIDSLFIDNCIAVAGTSIGKLQSTKLSKEKLVIVFDNQPRNKEVCKIISKTIDDGYRVVIWPQNITEKDINEMFQAGRKVNKIVHENIFSGLEAKAKFIGWKRC